MKIEKITITKFRSIENGTFFFEDILAIVGQNNSGKSAIMRSLNSFFNPADELENYINGSNLYTPNRTIPKIEIQFKNVPNKSIYNNHITNSTLTVKQEYNKKFQRLDYYIHNGVSFEIATDNIIIELFNDIQFILIPTERSVKYDNNNEISILKKLLNSYFSSHTANQDRLSPKVKDAFYYLKKNALSKVSKGIENKYLSAKGIKIEIDSNIDINYEVFINQLIIKIIENEKIFKLEECGSGIQSLVTISIYRYLANLNKTNFIIGIEEPEINLHPQAQKEFIYELLEEVNNGLQIIFTTHSTVLVDEIDHTKILLVRKEDDQKRKFKTSIYQLNNNFWNTYNLNQIQYDKFHRFKNSEFFFANHVIVTESPIDSEIFRNLLKSNGILIEKEGISILELGGITSLKYAFYLLQDLKIPKTIIVDKDFFLDYKFGSKNNSRYINGFFNYSNTFKSEILISKIIDDSSKRSTIEKYLSTNHSKAMEELIKFDIICMKYNLEMDLINSSSARNILYNELNIPVNDQNSNELLTKYEKKIKDLNILLNVINNLPNGNLPHSYKRIIKRFKDLKKSK